MLCSPNYSRHNCEIIDAEVQNILRKGAIVAVQFCTDEFISNLFLVPKKTGDFRPVIVQQIHFKMENINLACSSVKPGDCMALLDLKDAYFSVPMQFSTSPEISPIYLERAKI